MHKEFQIAASKSITLKTVFCLRLPESRKIISIDTDVEVLGTK